MARVFYHKTLVHGKRHLPFLLLGRKSTEKRLTLWLTAARKKEMGQRIRAEMCRAGTNANRLSKTIGCTRQALGYACTQGTISLELLTEVAHLLGASLDYIVFGRRQH